MKRWALIKNNFVDNVVEQEESPTVFTEGRAFWIDITGLHVGPEYKYIDGQFIEPDPPPVILNKIQMIEALGSNYVSIVAAAKTDVEMEVWLEKFRLKESFNLSEDSTKTELQFLVTKNIMTQEELNAILNQ